MTINFVPGDVNGGEQSVLHGRWKNHYVIVYGSGNNLIISVRTEVHTDAKNSLQTIYFSRDPAAIDFNADNAFIAVALEQLVKIYRPLNEYMSQPKWTEVTKIDSCGSTINCLQWAPAENELVIGTDDSIQLYHFYEEYGVLKWFKRWHSTQPLPTTNIKITHNANKIIAKSACYDRFLKLWSRINYGDDNTLFELSYLKHPLGDYVMDFRWRYRVYTNATFRVTDGSMARIKNIRNYIDSHTEDSDTLYTFTNDKVVRVWSTYEYTGHNHIKCWGELDLKDCFYEESVTAIVVIDNFYLKKCLFRYINDLPDSDLTYYFRNQDFDNFDLLLAISESGQVALYLVQGICMVPPNSVTFARINSVAMELDENCFLTIKTLHFKDEQITESFIQSSIYLRNLRPIIIPKTVFLNHNESLLSFLVHDRMKNTLKLNSFNMRKMLAPNAVTIGTTLLNKFQGHDKSIRILKKSHPFLRDDNVLLSALNFADHNYIWEPLILNAGGIKHVSITKRFLLDLTQNTKTTHENNRILDAVILNDIELLPGIRRHHLVVTFDALGYLCLWDCNGTKYDDKPAKLIRSDLIHHEGEIVQAKPQVFSLTEISQTIHLQEYCLVAIFSSSCIKSWKLSVYKNDLKIEFKKAKLTPPPIPEGMKVHKFSTLESYINEDEKNICSIIDVEGTLRIFAISYVDCNLTWVERICLPTNVRRASLVSGSTKINKFALVDESGFNLSVWDLNSQVLEYEESFPVEHGEVRDVDWCMLMSSKNLTSNALLSIGFARSVLLYTELRYDYTHDTPTYSVLKKIDVTDYTSHDIGDSIWINNGYLVIGCGNQFFIDDRWIGLESSPSQFLNSTIRELVKGYTHDDSNDDGEKVSKENLVFDLSNIVRILNGPLPLYHPQFLIQLLIMTHYKLAERIIVALFQFIRQGKTIKWDLDLDVLKEIQHEEKNVTKYQRLFQQNEDDDVFNTFNDSLTDLLTQHLTKASLPLITRHQQITLTSVVRILSELRKYLLTVDDNGMRFLMGLKLFQSSSTQTKLSMRDISFALHSTNKDVLIAVIEDSYSYKFTWSLIKKLGLVYWLDLDKLVTILEGVARNEFSESRDPSGIIALFYLAMSKKQILLGLWRTVSHPEKTKMLKFLSNDFTEKRWQTAAMKNAFVLMGKHRYVDAAYFFLLADSVKDCCNILVSKMNDFQLALMVAKVYCKTSRLPEGPVIRELIEGYLIQRAIEQGDKWLSSWIFWVTGEKEKAVQALIRVPDEMFKDSGFKYPGVVQKQHSSETFLMSDPASILLFKSLKTKTINYKIGSSQISKAEEIQMLLKTATIYTKMGCDFLALLLLRNWHFTYDEFNRKKASDKNGFDKFKQETHQAMLTPPPTAFEEPDMSAFDFGF